MRKKPSLFFVVLINIVLLIVALKILLKILFVTQVSNFYVEYKGILEKAVDPALAYQLKPLAQNKSYAINQNGFRGEPATIAKPSNTFRIIALGDSIMFGLGLSLQETYPVVVEQLLRKKQLWHKVEVINMGVPGYNTLQELAFVKNRGFELDPDLVILGFCSNDSDSAHVVDKNGVLVVENLIKDLSDVNLRSLLNQSRLFVYLKYLFKQMIYNNPELAKRFRINRYLNSRVYENSWKKMKISLLQMAEECRKRRIKFLVVIFPNQIQLSAPDEENKIQHDMVGFLQSNNIDYLNLLPAFINKKEEKLFLDVSVHPNRNGMIVASDATAEKISAITADNSF